MTKEIFIGYLNHCKDFDKQLEQWQNTLCTTIFESPLIEAAWCLQNDFLKVAFSEEGIDWITWWLYEKSGSDLQAYDENGDELPTDTPEDLWEIVKHYQLQNS